MSEDTRNTLIEELTEAETPKEILLVEMKFDAAARHQ